MRMFLICAGFFFAGGCLGILAGCLCAASKFAGMEQDMFLAIEGYNHWRKRAEVTEGTISLGAQIDDIGREMKRR